MKCQQGKWNVLSSKGYAFTWKIDQSVLNAKTKNILTKAYILLERRSLDSNFI